MTRRVCVVTGTRAEYGLLHWIMQDMKHDPDLILQIVVTGTHLSPEFGHTYQEIEKDGFQIDRKVEMLLSSDTPVGITKALGLGLIGFSDAFDTLRPELLILLGDRYEIFAASTAALIARIPVVHIHGGESTQGAIDEAFRHSITKMSHLHCVANDEYRKRVIQLGEHPDRVHVVGGLGLDNIHRLKLLTQIELEKSLDFAFTTSKRLLITFHPVTLENATAKEQMTELLAALEELTDTQFIFTMPNADTEGRIIRKMLTDFVKDHPQSRVYESLGMLRYLSCVAHVDGVVGNSSSGLTEVPSLKKGTINIGDRQLGRIKSSSVIDCAPKKESISNAIQKLFSQEFQKNLTNVQNPYGKPGASEKVVEIIKNTPLNSLLKKVFYDFPST